MDKNKDPGQVLIDLRSVFREAVTSGILSGDQKAIFELTLISILNEAEEQRQRCLKLKNQYEREAARAEAQAASFQMTQNLVYKVFGSIVRKLQKNEIAEDVIYEDEKQDLSENEIAAITAIAERQAQEQKAKIEDAKSANSTKKTTKKTISK